MKSERKKPKKRRTDDEYSEEIQMGNLERSEKWLQNLKEKKIQGSRKIVDSGCYKALRVVKWWHDNDDDNMIMKRADFNVRLAEIRW